MAHKTPTKADAYNCRVGIGYAGVHMHACRLSGRLSESASDTHTQKRSQKNRTAAVNKITEHKQRKMTAASKRRTVTGVGVDKHGSKRDLTRRDNQSAGSAVYRRGKEEDQTGQGLIERPQTIDTIATAASMEQREGERERQPWKREGKTRDREKQGHAPATAVAPTACGWRGTAR